MLAPLVPTPPKRESGRLTPLAPRLSPASVALSQSSSSIEQLSSIDEIRIADTHRSRDGAMVYELQVFSLCVPVSNIPTVRNSVGHGQSTTSTASSSSEQERRHPDLVVCRRFEDFTRLRHEALAASCVNAHFLCQYCRQFQTYARFHAAQPLWIVRVVTTTKQRQRILARFLDDLIRFAQSRVQRDRHCKLRSTLPKLIEKFMSD